MSASLNEDDPLTCGVLRTELEQLRVALVDELRKQALQKGGTLSPQPPMTNLESPVVAPPLESPGGLAKSLQSTTVHWRESLHTPLEAYGDETKAGRGTTRTVINDHNMSSQNSSAAIHKVLKKPRSSLRRIATKRSLLTSGTASLDTANMRHGTESLATMASIPSGASHASLNSKQNMFRTQPSFSSTTSENFGILKRIYQSRFSTWYQGTIAPQYTNLQLLSMFGESCIVVTILMNALCFGIQTEYMATNATEDIPGWFVVSEVFFCCVFTSELFVRVAKHRIRFFTMGSKYWNIFDCVLVIVSWVDSVMEISAKQSGSMGAAGAMRNMTFARLLRMLRLLRILRVARLLKFMGDINVVLSAIVGSVKSLLSTLFILMLMLYIIGVALTQVVTSHRIFLESQGKEWNQDLTLWWGCVGRSILSLFESIFGGVDWEDVVKPLIEIDVFYGLLYSAYIGFVLLAMMNVITGIFVESAIENAKVMKDKAFTHHVRNFFRACDSDGDGHISRQEMSMCFEDPNVACYMAELGIDDQDASILFDFLDDDNSNHIDSEELLAGLVRLRAGAKFIDMMTVLHEMQSVKVQMVEEIQGLKSTNMLVADNLKYSNKLLLEEIKVSGAPSCWPSHID